tara:strand:- start:1800 stop:2006 length:207 start_codon:yes stop_codon:yes gene_type:complete
MFDGYSPDRRPPYSQVVYYVYNGKKYKRTYYVCNGYGGSISISSSSLVLVGNADEENIIREQENNREE